MKQIIYYCCVFLLLSISYNLPLWAQNIDKAEVEKRIKKLFQDYEYYGAFVESFNDEQVSEAMISQFKALFDPSAMIYNDIKQSDNYGKKVSLLSYVNELKTWYPSGLSVVLSPPQLGNITCNKGTCQVLVPVNKGMGGLTKEGKDFRDNDVLGSFVIGFDATLQNFKILETKGVNEAATDIVAVKPEKKPKSASEQKSSAEPTAKADKPKTDKVKVPKTQKPIKNKPVKTENVFAKGNNAKAKRSIVGIYAGLGWTWYGGIADFSPFAGGDTDKLIAVDDLFEENLALGTRPVIYNTVLGLHRMGLTYQQYMGEKFGFTVGLGLHTYQSAIEGDIATQNYAVNNSQVGTAEPDAADFTRTFEAQNFREVFSYRSLSATLAAQHQWYSYVRNNAFRPYIKGGIELSLVSIGSSVTFEGNMGSTSTYRQGSTDFILEYLPSNKEANKIYNDVYWLYDSGSKITSGKPQTALIPQAAAFNISPFAEIGFDWMLDKNGKWGAFAAAQLSLGLLPLFATTDNAIYDNSDNVLLKRRNMATDSNTDVFYDYTPIEAESYEYRSLHGADAKTTPHFLGFMVGIKYIFKQGSK